MHGAGVARLLGRAGGAAVVVSALFVAAPSRADEPLAPQEDTNPNTKPPPSARVNVFLVGAAVTAGWYGVALGTSYLWSDSDGAASLRIPVAGPYMALAKTGCADTEPSCDTLTLVVRTVFTVLSAVGQTGGVLAMGEGLFMATADGSHRRAAARIPSAWERPARTRVTITPAVVGRSGYGLGFSASF
jgi:hypothetical protein